MRAGRLYVSLHLDAFTPSRDDGRTRCNISAVIQYPRVSCRELISPLRIKFRGKTHETWRGGFLAVPRVVLEDIGRLSGCSSGPIQLPGAKRPYVTGVEMKFFTPSYMFSAWRHTGDDNGKILSHILFARRYIMAIDVVLSAVTTTTMCFWRDLGRERVRVHAHSREIETTVVAFRPRSELHVYETKLILGLFKRLKLPVCFRDKSCPLG